MALVPCPCARYEIDSAERLCPYCGILLEQMGGTRLLSDVEATDQPSRWGTARFQTQMHLVFHVRDLNRSVSLPMDGMNEITIGRNDPATNERRDLDLTPFGAVERGVSRRHATIVRKDGTSLQITDNNSANGTYLNGQRLVPNQARILRDGDEVRFGRLVITVHFQRRDGQAGS